MGNDAGTCWLIYNDKSGSTREAVLDEIRTQLRDCGHAICQETCFPADDLPTPADLTQCGASIVVICSGDGTINAAVEKLSGWDGHVLILPGGTMNLLSIRLHGDVEVKTILERLAAGELHPRRPAVIRTGSGIGLAGVLAGPGTSWNAVREAMRDTDLGEMAEETMAALRETTQGPQVYCAQPELGRREGYPLLVLDPGEDGIAIDAYHADDWTDFLSQSFALIRRDFRDGPHDRLGCVSELEVGAHEDTQIGLLLDGEPHDCRAPVQFRLEPAPVDLLSSK
jgi:hypothetical protein